MISLDPGLRDFGVARFVNGELVEAKTLSGPSEDRGPSAWRHNARKFGRRFDEDVGLFVYEKPRVREGKRGYSGDLFELVGSLAAIASLAHLPERAEGYEAYQPREWIGSRPKEANHFRIWRELSESEREAFDVSVEDMQDRVESDSMGSLEHCLEAVGVGLYHLERLR